MKDIKQSKKSNDYPVARVLNTVLLTLVDSVREAEGRDLPEDYEIDDLNRAYIKLVYELVSIYNENPNLSGVMPEPFWKRYDTLKTYSWEILDYINDPHHDNGKAHINRLDRLCILADNEKPELSPEQLKLIEYAVLVVKNYRPILDNARLEYNAKIEDSWYIPKYWVAYENDGSIVINDVLKLKKPHIGSAIDRLLEQSYKNPNTLFMPDLGRTSRNFSTVLSSAGFIPVLRQLFFPVASKDKGVLFRPVVTDVQASKDGIDTSALDEVLKALGAHHTYSA